MRGVSLPKTLFGLVILFAVGFSIVNPIYSIDAAYVLFLLLLLLGGIMLVLEGTGPRSIRLRILQWRTSRRGRRVEWIGFIIALPLMQWYLSSSVAEAIFSTILILGISYLLKDHYYEKADNQKKEILREESFRDQNNIDG